MRRVEGDRLELLLLELLLELLLLVRLGMFTASIKLNAVSLEFGQPKEISPYTVGPAQAQAKQQAGI